jgi:NAD(P)-dependent dehydrogenase (short-subunit alcohol dehydrogenase family)
MTYTPDSIPDLTGTTTVVTGANAGLGFATAEALARKGSHVVMASRNHDKAMAAADRIRETTPEASVEVVERVDVLVNNAGLMAMPEGQTADGFETQFGVNHLGHWALTALLMPALLTAPKARVVTVTSTAHHFGPTVDPANPNLRGNYSPWKAYGQSKLANYHFALGLQREFDNAGVPAMSLLAHPGLSNTDLQVNTVGHGGVGFSGRFFMGLAARTGMTPAQGAMPQIRAATDPKAKGGEFYAPRFVNNGSPVRRRFMRPGADRAIANLWLVSTRETGIPMEV